MPKPSKFDVLLYLSQIKEPGRRELLKFLRRNILFENLSERVLALRLKELKEDSLAVDMQDPKTIDCLAFLYWSKMRGMDYNKLLNSRSVAVFKMLFERGPLTLKDLTGQLSKPTALKYIRLLEENNFITTLKRKPLTLKANLNDLTFFYANFLDLSFRNFERQFSIPDMPKACSKELTDFLIKHHAYSTTVTEGNTATEEDVERIFNNYPVGLTPREVTEVLNARSAVKELFKMQKNDLDLQGIKALHRVLMNDLIDSAGEFCYWRKKILGFKTKLPSSREQIDLSIGALLNFCKKKTNPISASIVHFVFASIHPFADGNGRMARLLHSWILIKNGFPLFVFDPEKRNRYFELLEKGRDESLEDFILFCLNEHYKSCSQEISRVRSIGVSERTSKD